MLFEIRADIPGPYHWTYTWCQSLSDKKYEFRELANEDMEVMVSEAQLRAKFEGGRSWPDVSANGGGFPHLLFSQAAIDLLLPYDPRAVLSDPAVVTFAPNKSLAKKGPPVYRTFTPSSTLALEKVAADGDSPELLAVMSKVPILVCNQSVKAHWEKAGLTNGTFRPLSERLSR